MTIYNIKNTNISWRGITLEGFGNEKICISQNNHQGSMIPIIGIFGEYFYYPNVQRSWQISSSFLVNSPTYRLLEQDNNKRIQGSLIIRDLNLGTSDIFTDACIYILNDKKDAASRQVTWISVKRNEL